MFIAIVVAAAVAAVVVITGLLLPSRWFVRRTILVRAAPEELYPLIADFERGWTQWSPFGRAEDPTVEFAYTGPASGLGAVQSWNGKKFGTGTMTISRSDPEAGITFELETQGFRLTGTLELERLDGETRVTWTDRGDVGRNPFLRLATALLVERFVGKNLARILGAVRQSAGRG